MNRWILVLALCLGSLLGTEALACQKYAANVQDDAGNLLGGVSITVTTHNTATVATLYSDPGCAATLANPFTSNTDGSYSFYAQDGHYSFAFVKSGYSIAPVLDVVIFEPLGVNVKSVAEFSSPDDICAASTGAIAETADTVRTIYVNAAVACTQNTTAPSTISWVFIGKGSITVSITKTLTINGLVTNLTDHAVWIGSGTTTFGLGAGPDPYGARGTLAAAYSASITIDASLGTTFTITPNNAVAFAVSSITRPAWNRRLRLNIINTTGSTLGAGTFPCCKTGAAWTQPINGTNRSIEFEYTGTVWQEVGRTAADVTN